MSSLQPRTATEPPGLYDYAILTLLGAIWGGSFLFVKIAVATVPALPTTIVRMLLAAVVMVALVAVMRVPLPPWGRVWWFVALSALFGNTLPFFLIAWGEEKIESGLAAILMAPSPLIAAVLAHYFTPDEKLNRWTLGGIGLAIFGVAVLMGIDKLGSLGADWIHQMALLGAGACYAVNAVINRRLTGGSGVGNVAAVIVVSAVMLAPLALIDPAGWRFSPSTSSLLAIVALAVSSTAIGTILMIAIIRRQGAAFSAQVNFLVPIFGVIWGALILAEQPSMRSLVGLGLVLAGVAVARRGQGRLPARKL